eukprot:7047417-Pyramimonas_sp.AAC.1
MARSIQSSIHIRRVFVNYARKSLNQAIRSGISIFRAAARRFESFQKPWGRTCLFLHARIRTALRIPRRQID